MSLMRYVFILLLLGSVFAGSTTVAATQVGAAPIFANAEQPKGEEEEEPECD